MQALIFVFFIFVSNVFAESSLCQKNSFENNEEGKALLFFQSLEGRFKIGSCFVEVKYCESSSANKDGSSKFIGDVFVLDSDGDERYIPIYLTKSKVKKSHGLLMNSDRSFIYRFKDKNRDDLSGNYEWFDLEIVKKKNLSDIDFIEIGYSSQHERKKRTTKKWIVCGEEREEYVKDHPVKYRYRSWWWWLTHF